MDVYSASTELSEDYVDSLGLGDPAKVRPFIEGATGVPSAKQAAKLYENFKNPPYGYGQVPFYWWVGDSLTKERLKWQIDKLEKCEGIMGIQINYCHGYKNGGEMFGLSEPSDPPLFTENWWDLMSWFQGEAEKQKWSISLSDYTLGPGQGFSFDDLIHEYPELRGAMLEEMSMDVKRGSIVFDVPEEVVCAVAIEHHAKEEYVTDLLPHISNGILRWFTALPVKVVVISVKRVEMSIDPMHPDSGRLYAEKFFGQFDRKFPGQAGAGLNFFFSDELNFNVHGNIWNDEFADEFQKRKGYDLKMNLHHLYHVCGPQTPKVRLDYNDVMVRLSEEGFFKPVFDWHQERNMILGCDHGGRGLDVLEFGDYFRTQRWNQGPGCDQPGGQSNLIKNKVASSIAQLYNRPRVWLEGYYSSGWGTSTQDLVRATFSNFAQGQNLLSLHGLYYTTHGGYWEWAPPCNHFRMPYWSHMKTFFSMVQRISFLLSQGAHQSDVAIFYPVEPSVVGDIGKDAVEVAFGVAEAIYSEAIDFIFIDAESLGRAVINNGKLEVSGGSYKTLILPAMKSIRWQTLLKILDFHRKGGQVLALGELPHSSDRIGAHDHQLNVIVNEIFGGMKNVFKEYEELCEELHQSYLPDVTILTKHKQRENFMHRKIDDKDVYFFHNLKHEAELKLRSTGELEAWDCWTGEALPVTVLEQTEEYTRFLAPASKHDGQIFVFKPGRAKVAPTKEKEHIKEVTIEGDWEFELVPTMDNAFGDFHWPPTKKMIGPELRFLWYNEGEDKPKGSWKKVGISYGPQFMRCKELPDITSLEKPKSANRVEFSWRWGIENDPGHQGYHGLKELVHDHNIVIGKNREQGWNKFYIAEEEDTILWTTVNVSEDSLVYVHLGSIEPKSLWINGELVTADTVSLKKGDNPIVLHYDKENTGRTYFVLSKTAPEPPKPDYIVYPKGEKPVFELKDMMTKWAKDKEVIPFNIHPGVEKTFGWFRFKAPPGLKALNMKMVGNAVAIVDGKEYSVSEQGFVEFSEVLLEDTEVYLKVDQEKGCCGGSVFEDPVELICDKGPRPLGDWSKNEGLVCYSGGAWYRKTITVGRSKNVILNLGKVSSTAEIKINGKDAGTYVSAPWRIDISDLVVEGENKIEVLVYNTLSNHYVSIPTNYRGSLESGLIGPVTLELS